MVPDFFFQIHLQTIQAKLMGLKFVLNIIDRNDDFFDQFSIPSWPIEQRRTSETFKDLIKLGKESWLRISS